MTCRSFSYQGWGYCLCCIIYFKIRSLITDRVCKSYGVKPSKLCFGPLVVCSLLILVIGLIVESSGV